MNDGAILERPLRGCVPDVGKGRQAMVRYQCQICGHIYDPDKGDPERGIAPGKAFEELPEDWTCPECGAAKDQYAKL